MYLRDKVTFLFDRCLKSHSRRLHCRFNRELERNKMDSFKYFALFKKIVKLFSSVLEPFFMQEGSWVRSKL